MSTTPSRLIDGRSGYRRDLLWIAALVHRLSGIGLAVFLPFHFLALGLAIEGEAALDGFLQWTHNPFVRITEIGLVVLLTLHLLGGIRVLLIENLAWQPGQRSKAVTAILVALLAGLAFASMLI